jgi:inner membrane protein
MDLLTHIALGTVLGEATKKSPGMRYTMLGSAVQVFPDIDIIGSLWMEPSENLLFHRGITHSFLAALFFPLLFSFMARYGDKLKLSFNVWFQFFVLQYLLHLFVDLFNAYGVGLLEPFVQTKFSIHALYVVDPFFSAALVGGLLFLLIDQNYTSRKKIMAGSLVLCSIYLMYAVFNKVIVNDNVRDVLKRKNVQYSKLLTTPTPFNSWLWFSAAESSSGYYICYSSVFDSSDDPPVAFVPKNDNMAIDTDAKVLHNLRSFSQGYYTLEQWGDTLVFNDLRFGQISGWENATNKFAFHFYLNLPDENKFVMQRGRVSGWNIQTMRDFIKRIGGVNLIPVPYPPGENKEDHPNEMIRSVK